MPAPTASPAMQVLSTNEQVTLMAALDEWTDRLVVERAAAHQAGESTTAFTAQLATTNDLYRLIANARSVIVQPFD